MDIKDMEKLAFIILKEIGSNKSDVELVQSIQHSENLFCNALKQIPVQLGKAKAMKRPF